MGDIQIESREDVADWVETTLLTRQSPIGIDELNSLAKEEGDLSESEVGLGLRVMRVRQRWLGEQYPFQLSDIYVAPHPQAAESLYAALLLLSPGSPNRQLFHPQPSQSMAALFEKIVVEATQRMMGPQTRAVRFGWPSDIGRPERFSDAIEWLAQLMGIKSGTAFRSPLRKDGGVDVVAWRPFPDKRSAFPVALVQCTVQREVVSKSRDIDVRNWSGWLALDIDPTTILAIPGTVAKTEDWNEIALRALILDRIRLVGLLDNSQLASFEYGLEFVNGSLIKLRRWKGKGT
jgi:hypothetical protein